MIKLKRINENQELEEAGRGRPPKNASSTTLGQSIDKTAETINAEDNIVEDEEKGIIEDELNELLAINKRLLASNAKNFVNCLLVGEAGTGKSSRVRAWAERHGINLFEKHAADLDQTDFGGAITPDKEGTRVNRLASTEFDALDRPNSVLFLDEYNRAPSAVRTTLLELVNSHFVPDPREPSGMRKLKGFLFTVAAVNPSTSGYDTDRMDRAERTRFERVDVPSEKGNLKRYLVGMFNRYSKECQERNDEEGAKENAGRAALADALLSDKEFSFNTSKEADELEEEGLGEPLNSRTLELALNRCNGTKESLLKIWSRCINTGKKPMAERILSDYQDINDKANSALKHDSESKVFKKKESNFDKIMAELEKD